MEQVLLMHKNNIVAKLNIDTDNTASFQVDTIINPTLLPIGVQNCKFDEIGERITDWNDGRCIPFNRDNYCEFLKEINTNSTTELSVLSNLCSLTDCYWFKSPNSETKWEDINFHENRFSSNLYRRIFYGDKIVQINNLHSPDLATDGAVSKMWYDDGTYFHLIKGHFGSNPIDACYEVIASSILSEIGIDHVPYYLCNINGSIMTSCPCFISDTEEEFVPIINLVIDSQFQYVSDYVLELLNSSFRQDLEKMFLCDSIIGNMDRHARNYGFIVDSDTKNIKRFAPLFDHGICVMEHKHGFLNYHPTGKTFNETVNSLSTEILLLTNNINLNTIKETIQKLPIAPQQQDGIYNNLVDRIEKIQELAHRREYGINREI